MEFQQYNLKAQRGIHHNTQLENKIIWKIKRLSKLTF